MQSSPNPSNEKGVQAVPSLMSTAFAQLLDLPLNADKSLLMSKIDASVTEILSDLVANEEDNLASDELSRVQVTLHFLEQCLAFKDQEFTDFAKKRAHELETALVQTLSRMEQAKHQKTPDIPQDLAQPKDTDKAPFQEAQSDAAVPESQNGFAFVREENLLIDFAFDKIEKRLKFLRGDFVKVIKQKQVLHSGIRNDGVAPIFFMSPKFTEILRPSFEEMVREKRDLFERRVYIYTSSDMSDDQVSSLYEETYRGDIMMIIALEFDNWAGEMINAGIGGLPKEREKKKAQTPKEADGVGASLKKVFSFGSKKTKNTPKSKKRNLPDCLPVRTYKSWQSYENKGDFYLSQHFSFSLLSYILNLNEKQFDGEYVTMDQIVDQQDEPDVGPVITNLSRLYKYYDNIFFDLVILVLFQRDNKFDINMLQAACMSQNFVVDRLPLTMDELRRRPMEHAKHILKTLNEPADKNEIEQALIEYFHVHETIHSNKVGKRIQASENLLKRQGDKLDEKFKKVTDGLQSTLCEINSLKTRQEEQGVFLGDEIDAVIQTGIQDAIAHL